MKTLFTCLLAFFLLTGCQNQAVDENRELAKSVMAIHDEAMAKMTEMHELKLSLQKVETDSGKLPSTTKAISDLQSASKGMMTWMHTYKAPQTDKELESAREYLLAEKIKIQQVQSAINMSISQAKDLM